MIKILVERTKTGLIQSFTMEGHADYAEKGQDIVCAGASAVAFGSVNAIIALAEITPEIEQSESGYLKCSFHNHLDNEKVQLLLEGMIVSLESIEREYGDYLTIRVKQ